jgi:hypothetical protein
MKKTLFILLLLLCSFAYAQDPINKVAKPLDRDGLNAPDTVKPWTLLGTAALNITQASFTNWSSGGQNSFGVGALFNLKADYKKKKQSWKNNLDLAYGFQFLGKGSDAYFTKTDDKIEYTTSYGYAISKHWDVTLLANFRTQFSDGYNYPNDSIPISKIMAPGYLVAGIGVNYVPAEYFTLYISPSAGRFTFVLDDTLSAHGAFGVEKGKNMKGEFGPYLRAVFNKELFKNITLNTSLELFSDYLHKFGNVDVNWNVLLGLKVNKWLSTTINTQLIYDDDVMIKFPSGDEGPRTQFKEVIGVGLSYTFH